MSDQPIAPNVVMAALAAYAPDGVSESPRQRVKMEAAIHAADLARGLTVAWRAVSPSDPPVEVSENTARSFIDIPDAEHTLEWRFVGPWVPVGGEAQT
jgi:hypothetical protein